MAQVYPVGHPVLGKRICITGPSACGKSTLADAIGKKYGLPIVHLDKLYHLPNDFIPRPDAEYLMLHDNAIAEDSWIMEGNYGRSMPQRFERADSIIKVEMNRFGALWRFLTRYYLNQTGKKPRIGQPDIAKEKFSWKMVWWILEPQSLNSVRRQKNSRVDALMEQHAQKIHVVRSFKEMQKLLDS